MAPSFFLHTTFSLSFFLVLRPFLSRSLRRLKADANAKKLADAKAAEAAELRESRRYTANMKASAIKADAARAVLKAKRLSTSSDVSDTSDASGRNTQV